MLITHMWQNSLLFCSSIPVQCGGHFQNSWGDILEITQNAKENGALDSHEKNMSTGHDQQRDSQAIYFGRFQQESKGMFQTVRKRADLLQNSASAWVMM